MNHWEEILSRWVAHGARLRCPLCEGGLAVRERALVCPQNHTHNIARQGYASFSPRGENDYGAALWKARRAVSLSGFFDPLLDAAADLLGRPSFAVDAGCGEGTLTARLAERTGGVFLGADLSREGVRRAAGRDEGGLLWAVADLARLPLADGAAGAVVNLLAPARYDEFTRILSPRGRLLKAIPTERHLKELRAFWSAPPPTHPGRAEALFAARFPAHRSVTVEATRRFDRLLPDLAAMTPLSWHRAAKELPGGMEVTLSLRVLCALPTFP